MSSPFLGEIRLMSFSFPPRNWALCNGQIMPINENQALFSLLGTTYGGNGTTNFALPDLRGRVPLHAGTDLESNESYLLGFFGGAESHILQTNQLPSHTHTPKASALTANSKTAGGNLWATTSVSSYHTNADTTMAAGVIALNTGGNQPHSNVQPSLTISFCIALAGIFPSRS